MSDDQSYVGQAGPPHFSTPYSAAEFLIQQALNHVRTATYGKIIKAPYDKDGNSITPGSAVPIGFVDVLPLVNQIDGRGNATEHGTVYKLSYHRYQSGHGAVIADPKAGDIGLFSVADRDLTTVKNTGDKANPGSRRRHDLADGTFLGSVIAGSPTQWISFGDGSYILIHDKNGNEIKLHDKGITITDKVNTNVIDMKSNGIFLNGAQVTTAGDVIEATRKVKLSDHVHGGIISGGEDTDVPVEGS